MKTCKKNGKNGTFHTPGTLTYSGKKKNGVWKKTCLEQGPRGSLTLETAMALPLFLFFILAVMSFLMMMHVQICVQSSMEDTARKLGKAAYLLQRADGAKDASAELDQEVRTILQAGINSATIQLSFFSDGTLRQMLDGSRVRGGALGLSTYASSYEPETGILDVVVSYDYQVPWLPGPLGNLRLVQRAHCHAWVGDALKAGSGSGDPDTKKVYVTPTGTVYHTSPDCHYLDLSIKGVSGSEVAGLRNASGAKYAPCEECARSGFSATVYITDYGTSYHNSLGCSGLKRTVQEVELEDVGDMRMCTKCAAKEAHEH